MEPSNATIATGRAVLPASDPAQTSAPCVKAQAKYTANNEAEMSFNRNDGRAGYSQVRTYLVTWEDEWCKHSHTHAVHSLPYRAVTKPSGTGTCETDNAQIVIIPFITPAAFISVCSANPFTTAFLYRSAGATPIILRHERWSVWGSKDMRQDRGRKARKTTRA
jgi:hypothetical protein